MPRFLIALALLLASTSALAADKPATPSPEAIAAVVGCYMGCRERYTDYAIDRIEIEHNSRDRVSGKAFCRHMRTGLLGVMHCQEGCDEVRAAYGNPPSKLRVSLKTALDAEETVYRALTCNLADYAPLDEGIKIAY